MYSWLSLTRAVHAVDPLEKGDWRRGVEHRKRKQNGVKEDEEEEERRKGRRTPDVLSSVRRKETKRLGQSGKVTLETEEACDLALDAKTLRTGTGDRIVSYCYYTFSFSFSDRFAFCLRANTLRA